jgi:hypothetical protein
VHDGGRKVTLVNRTSGRHVCTSVARYGTNPDAMGSMDAMTTCAWDALGVVRTGDVLGLHSHYDTPEPAAGVMGIMLVYVHPTDDLSEGVPPPDAVARPGESPVPAPAPAAHHH